MTRVTAIIPAHDRAHTLGRALSSVLAQTRAPEELIVVDDGSTDATPEVAASFAGIRLLRLPRNAGAAHARNAGAKAASGDYLAFLDSDDAWATDKLERQLAFLAAKPATDLLCTGITVHAVDDTVSDYTFGASPPAGGWTLEHLQTYPFSTSTWLIRRSALAAAGFFDETLPNSEDLDLLSRLVRHNLIEMLPGALTIKHNQGDGLNRDYTKTVASTLELFRRHADLWERAPVAAARTWQRLGVMHAGAGDMQQARAALWQATRRQPLEPRHWARLGLACLGATAFRAVPAMLRRR